MKKVLLIIFSLIIAAVILSPSDQPLTYVGAAKCQICHKTDSQGRQYPIWQAGKHASSFVNLSSAKAASMAQSLGVKDPTGDPKCLKCHAPLFAQSPEVKAEGVTCEACHGPGSEYKKLSLMKDPTEARKNGLVLFADAAAVKDRCLACHANAHNLPFDFASAWDKIKHNIPRKE